jgi:hypothetical protein
MSAFGGKADIAQTALDVRQLPIADAKFKSASISGAL